ncbi:5-oxoprolinase subunit C family protein [Streptomonospora wellingtoniae]|uniref:Biotin-dependent carboxyltransferase family protein n=1 Tax=Streptomonospora wellingtoniae TaxID=3075544 RepID=A0ABU2KW44_9ACTN|nr:biotin-dependent carboxyltransferase family protein [Streptomonospora sp. DSM 45055]MDT0303509.1 biotin-dependent carboxyltransferase family protein [Streptomonospora sp. DSM 45055]
MPAVEVVRTGVLSTVQDSGRRGHAALGVGGSGAADRASYALANRLLANPEGAAALEATMGGLVLRARGAVTAAVTGAPCPVAVDGRGAATGTVLHLPDGAELRLGPPPSGLRSYVAVRGGLDVAPVLGSRSTDTLAGLGPPPPQEGTVLPVGPAPRGLPTVDWVPVPPFPERELSLRVVPGPRDDWFGDGVLEVLLSSAYEVTSRSDRIGARLWGPALSRLGGGELPSEGMVPGSLQVPPEGRPVLFLADHPVTGGYPVIAVVVAADVSRAAQARPGARLRFHL